MSTVIPNAFVLGAGLGTRLRGLTARRPKPLIPICNKPLITFAFDHLLGAGVKSFVVNTHHRAESYEEVFPEKTYRDAHIYFKQEDVLLETGGGIKNCERRLGAAPFIAYNGDILTDLPLAPAIAHHFERGNEVTLVLRSSGGPLHIALDEKSGRVTDIHRKLNTQPGQEFLFTGIYIVEPAFFARIPEETKISVVPAFLEMIGQNAKLGGVVIDEGRWWDLGTREQDPDVHRFFYREEREGREEKTRKTATSHTFGVSENWPLWVHPTAKVSPDARLSGATVIGPRAKIGKGAVLTDSIVWEDAEIGVGSSLENCIVTAAQRVQGMHRNTDF